MKNILTDSKNQKPVILERIDQIDSYTSYDSDDSQGATKKLYYEGQIGEDKP